MRYFIGGRNQKGHGLGGIFRTVLRVAMPLLRKAAVPLLKRTAKTAIRAVGKQALTSGAALAGDLMAGKSFKAAAKARGGEGLRNVMSATRRAVMGASGSPPGPKGVKRKGRTNKTDARRNKYAWCDVFA